MAFAENTSVSVARTRAEIEALLEKHRATKTFSAVESGRAVVGFQLQDRLVQFELTLPLVENFAKKKDSWGYVKQLSAEQQRKNWEQACRTVWRGLLLSIKAKFVAVEAGVETFEEAFLAHVLVPGTGRFYSWAKGQLERAYGNGVALPMLPAGEAQP